MGTVCSRCSEIEKGGGAPSPGRPYEEEQEEEDLSDEGSEVQASSDEEEDTEGMKQGVADILNSTGQNLKRGKTMAMKEAISTAKKVGLENSKITEAERRLDEHKKQQRREEVQQEIEQFSQSAAYKDISMVDKMIKKATDADCDADVIKKLQQHLEELFITRNLEDDEIWCAREYLKQSCREFVLAATKGFGRPVTVLKLEDGTKAPANLALDPPLQNASLVYEDGTAVQVPLVSLNPLRGKDDKKVSKSVGFQRIDKEERECVVSFSYDENGKSGMWCIVEPTALKRDRLFEAVLVLTTACR